MTDEQKSLDEHEGAGGCPHAVRLPVSVPLDGTPLRPSPLLTAFREAGPAVPLLYEDGHEGLLATTWEFGRAVLEDGRFSMASTRFPLNRSFVEGLGSLDVDTIDAEAMEALRLASLLDIDPPQHGRVRKTFTGRLSVRAVRTYQDSVRAVVCRQLTAFLSLGAPADLTADFAEPVSAHNHCMLLGIPDDLVADFFGLFLGSSTQQAKFDFVRAVVAAKAPHPEDDLISDLLRSELTPLEVEGVVFMLMVSGRDSVAFMIVTAIRMLLENPDQLALLRRDPDLIETGIEEIMRYGSMFVTAFSRLATEDVDILGVPIARGTSVSASPVAANRDPARWQDPDVLDLSRDAFGHLSFGHGLHVCAGQQFARMQLKEAITQILAAMPDLRLVTAEQDEPIIPFPSQLPTYAAGRCVVAW